MQKSLEVRTPLVQNGADEHGPDRGDITVEWAHFGRLNGVFGKYILPFRFGAGYTPLSNH